MEKLLLYHFLERKQFSEFVHKCFDCQTFMPTESITFFDIVKLCFDYLNRKINRERIENVLNSIIKYHYPKGFKFNKYSALPLAPAQLYLVVYSNSLTQNVLFVRLYRLIYCYLISDLLDASLILKACENLMYILPEYQQI